MVNNQQAQPSAAMACASQAAIRQALALAYRIVAHLQMDDHTYTHLSARGGDVDGVPTFYIYPFGRLFEEVTPEMLLRVSLDGTVLEGSEAQYNRTGYMIHGSLYRARADVQAIFHVHTPAMVAVSAMRQGLRPLSQWALHFYNRVAYHTYDSLEKESTQGQTLVHDLGEKNVMLMRHHGALTCGRTLHEALFYLYHLQQACEAQVMMSAQQEEPLAIPDHVCKRTVQDLLGFEKDLGWRDWQAWERKLDAF